MATGIADLTKTPSTGISNGNTATDVDLNTNDEVANRFEAAEVIFSMRVGTTLILHFVQDMRICTAII
jgi:hypothetical protein